MAQQPLSSDSSERRTTPRTAYRKRRRRRERVHMFGQLVDLVKPEEVLHHVQDAVAEGRKTLVANHNLHSLYLIQKHPEMLAFYEKAEMIEVDSTPMIWFSRALGLHSRGFHRCTYLDWRDHFWSVADRKGWRVMSVGGEPGVGEEAARRLGERYPRAEIRTRHGFFDARAGSADNAEIVAEIQALGVQTAITISAPMLRTTSTGTWFARPPSSRTRPSISSGWKMPGSDIDARIAIARLP